MDVRMDLCKYYHIDYVNDRSSKISVYVEGASFLNRVSTPGVCLLWRIWPNDDRIQTRKENKRQQQLRHDRPLSAKKVPIIRFVESLLTLLRL